MLAVVKTPHTELEIRGFISPKVLKILQEEYGNDLEVMSEDDGSELKNIFDTEEYKEFKERVTPGDYVKVYRENLQLTQVALGEKLGLSRAYICDIEHDRRGISKEVAKKLSEIFKVSVSRFI